MADERIVDAVIREWGNRSRYLAVGKVFPRDWKYVRMRVKLIDDRHALIEVERMD